MREGGAHTSQPCLLVSRTLLRLLFKSAVIARGKKGVLIALLGGV